MTGALSTKCNTNNLRSACNGKKLGVVPKKDLLAIGFRLLLWISCWGGGSKVAHHDLLHCLQGWKGAWLDWFVFLINTLNTNHPLDGCLPHLGAKIVALTIDTSCDNFMIEVYPIINLCL